MSNTIQSVNVRVGSATQPVVRGTTTFVGATNFAAALQVVSDVANSALLTANTSSNTANGALVVANGAFIEANASFSRANTSANSIVGTTGSVTPTSGSITLSSTNGVTTSGSGNTITINTPQDVRTSASPTFNALTLTNALAIAQGGTGASSAGSALTALMPTGTTAGYVLTTGGPGSFYWAAGGGGGSGATPGTTINSSRLSYTANGVTGYTGNTYTIPTASATNQVRVYINGVRQFESEYSLNLNANSITFSTTPTNLDKILVEVDGEPLPDVVFENVCKSLKIL